MPHRTMTTLHRTIKALPREELDELAVDYGIDTQQRRLDIEYALLSRQHDYIAHKVLARLRKALQRESAA